MGDFFASLTKSLTTPQLDAQRAIQQLALQQVLNPDLDPTVRAQYAALLKGTPYEALTGISMPEAPGAALQREFAPTLAALSAAGTLFPALDEEGARTAASRIEELTGFRFPRTQVTEPGPELVPATPLADLERFRAGERGETLAPGGMRPAIRGEPVTRQAIDVSRFRPQQIMVDIPGLGRMPALDAVKLIGEEGMRRLLLAGSGARIRIPGVGWMDLADAAKAIGPEGVRNILGVEAPADTESRARRTQATAAYNAWLTQRPGDQTGAYNAAFALDPTFPTPGTLPGRPETLSPQQQTWDRFFTKGWDALSEPQRQYIASQLRNDDELTNAFKLISTYGGVDPGKLTAAERALLDRSQALVAERLGVPVEQVQQAPMGFIDRLKFLFTGKTPPPTGGPMTAQAWASRQLDNFRATGQNILGHAPRSKQDFRRLFNTARRDPRYQIPKDYWRVLLELIEAMK